MISTGKRSITGPMSATSVIERGPPVDEPIRSTRGASMLNGRRANCSCATGAATGWTDTFACPLGGRRDGRARGWLRTPASLGAQMTNLLNQIVVEGLSGSRLARALRLWNVVGRAERQRLEADLRVAAGQRRRHDDDEVALFASSCGSAEMPSSSGISISSTATSGLMRSIWLTASRPVRNEAETSMSGSAPIQREIMPRITTKVVDHHDAQLVLPCRDWRWRLR